MGTVFSEINEGQKDNFHMVPLIHKACNNADFTKVDTRAKSVTGKRMGGVGSLI